MCFRYDADPAIPPIAGAAIDTEDLTLEASDGTKLAAFIARAENPLGPAVLVLPDVRGLFRFYEELAMRFAEIGYDSVAIDYFGRTAGVAKRDAEFPFREHVAQSTFDGVKADAAAGVAFLRQSDPDRKVFTIGFCFGGSNSWHQAANGLGLSGAIGFYGHPNREFPSGATPMVERVGDIECPILGLMGGADPGIPQDEVDGYDKALTAAGVSHELVSYEGAPHSFFDRAYEEFAKESADAWERVQTFIKANS
ncbi:MAG TPA: dienelactone hydrolase family protein [Dehalococcoidia bacterium]|nr:dienelactone hydrolase family protein [Dehalococcoidia bacterium]